MLLFVNCCISQRETESRTLKICRAFLDRYAQSHPEEEIAVEDLRERGIPNFDRNLLDERDLLMQKERFEEPIYDMARRFHDADRILVGAPYWDLLFPAELRAYIEHVSANGLCYHYEPDGCHGDCRAKKLVYITSGGGFEEKPCVPAEYWRQLCTIFGIPEFDYVFAEGVDVSPEMEEQSMRQAIQKAEELTVEM